MVAARPRGGNRSLHGRPRDRAGRSISRDCRCRILDRRAASADAADLRHRSYQSRRRLRVPGTRRGVRGLGPAAAAVSRKARSSDGAAVRRRRTGAVPVEQRDVRLAGRHAAGLHPPLRGGQSRRLGANRRRLGRAPPTGGLGRGIPDAEEDQRRLCRNGARVAGHGGHGGGDSDAAPLA